MKRIKYFIKFVELQTKVISLFPFLIAVLYYVNYLAVENNNNINYLNFALFFFSMLSFDMLTTAINHYQAFKTEKDDQSKYDLEILAMMKELDYTQKNNKYFLFILLSFSTILGVLLVFLSNIGVLLLGAFCFLIGISYSFGPKPISNSPFGEIFAGGTMGVILPIIVIFTQYNHLPFELNPFLAITFLPLSFLIANILLANNICDFEKDVNNKRYTIVYYLGEKTAKLALLLSNILAYLVIVIALLFNFISGIHYLLIFISLIITHKNIIAFIANPIKHVNFVLIVKNFIVFSLAYILTLIYSIVML